MKHPNWRVAGAAGLAAGLTVGGFSLVSASSVERAVQAVEFRESRAAPTADPVLLVVAKATTTTTHSLDPASQDKPPVAPTPVVLHEPEATPKATHTATPKATVKATAPAVHRDDCADCADCANGVHCADSATSVDSADSADSVSVDSCDSDD
jgi:Pyruvate/2-oxoacid:ferredoxin oxidoreductase delta subunit